MKGIFTNTDGNTVEINKDDLYSYRGITNGCVVLMKDGLQHNLKNTFEEVDYVFDFLTPIEEPKPLKTQ